jgi:hypothetical protein
MMRRLWSMVALACTLILGSLWPAPAWAADFVPGYGVETASVLPSQVPPGTTISASVDLSQTTPYPLQ